MQDPCRYAHPILTDPLDEGHLGPTHRERCDGGPLLPMARNESFDRGRCDALTESHGSVQKRLPNHRSDSWRVLRVLVALQFLHCVLIGRQTCAPDRRFWHG